MLSIGALSFTAPWVLAALLALPVIWWLLRVTPPSPQRVRFPALRLLLGLKEEEETPAHMPPWLLALRLLLAALIILALAGPLWNAARGAAQGAAEIVVLDNGWAAAPAWTQREDALRALIEAAERRGAVLAIVETAPERAQKPVFAPASRLSRTLPAIAPRPFDPDRMAALKTVRKLKEQAPEGELTLTWLSDGLDYGKAAEFTKALQKLGGVRVRRPAPEALPLGLRPVTVAEGALEVTAIRAQTKRKLPGREGTARALDEKGGTIGLAGFTFEEGATEAAARFDLPLELRNRVARIEISEMKTAGAVTLLDESARRRPVGLVSGGGTDAGQPLLAETYYLRRALKPYAEIREGTIGELIGSGLSLLVLADVGRIVGEDVRTVKDWVERGGVLLRFAGPRMARQTDELVPVQLRRGGRALGGALSWDTPQELAPFDADSPFAGLELPEDVTVSRQVLAEPSVDLGEKTWARLEDGTPLVTAARQGEGWLVLVHVTANTDWSNLPLSGLYVQMLRRIAGMGQAVKSAGGGTGGDTPVTRLPPRLVLDGYGRLVPPPPTAAPLKLGAEEPEPGPRTPPGLYGHGNAERALNLIGAERTLAAAGGLPSGVSLSGYGGVRELGLKAPLLALALMLALADGVIALAISGRLRGLGGLMPARRGAGAAVLLIAGFAAFAFAAPVPAQAAPESDKRIMEATLETRLAYVRTGVPEADKISRAGLAGLSRILHERTAVEPGAPMAVDVETDELAVFPLLYWRVTAGQEPPSSAALQRIDRFMKNGGMILFDTADQQQSASGTVHRTSAQRALRAILEKLDVPPLMQVPQDHVLTKAFYILRDQPDEWFPGRWAGGDVWVEAARGDGAEMSNDGVSSLVIGSNDWAAAWATDSEGRAVAAVVPGGRRQREFAYRFGVNLVMYTLTGNYKADQVHVPAILERLGQ
ncbi:MAG: DUF4159 domain-containing protein [Alphaproteobacteria bacterium]